MPFVFVLRCHARGECARVRGPPPPAALRPCPDPVGPPGSHRGRRAAALRWPGAGRRPGHVVPGPAPRRSAAWRSVSIFRGFGDWGWYRAGGWGVWGAGGGRHCGSCWAAGLGLEASALGRTEKPGGSRAWGAASTDGALVGAWGDVGNQGPHGAELRSAQKPGRPGHVFFGGVWALLAPTGLRVSGRSGGGGARGRGGLGVSARRLPGAAGPLTGGFLLATPGFYLSGTFPFRSIFKRRCLPHAASLDVFGCEPRSGPVEGLGPYGWTQRVCRVSVCADPAEAGGEGAWIAGPVVPLQPDSPSSVLLLSVVF